MAYMGRGGFSSFGGGLRYNNSIYNRNKDRMYYRGGFIRMHYYIPLDNSYVVLQMIVAIIIFAVAGITFLTTYKPSIIDPLEDTKRIIIHTYIAIIITLIVITVLVNYFSKDKNVLIKRLITILLISVITILFFLGTKASMDSTYTKNKFEQIYIQENGENNSNERSKIDIGLTGVQMKTEKEYYIDECVKAYKVFYLRMYGIVAINVLLIFLLIYQILKVAKIQESRDKISKDDAILFDEEENIKF